MGGRSIFLRVGLLILGGIFPARHTGLVLGWRAGQPRRLFRCSISRDSVQGWKWAAVNIVGLQWGRSRISVWSAPNTAGERRVDVAS